MCSGGGSLGDPIPRSFACIRVQFPVARFSLPIWIAEKVGHDEWGHRNRSKTVGRNVECIHHELSIAFVLLPIGRRWRCRHIRVSCSCERCHSGDGVRFLRGIPFSQSRTDIRPTEERAIGAFAVPSQTTGNSSAARSTTSRRNGLSSAADRRRSGLRRCDLDRSRNLRHCPLERGWTEPKGKILIPDGQSGRKILSKAVPRPLDSVGPRRSLRLHSVPSLMMWDDHDIFDGWGSYETELQ